MHSFCRFTRPLVCLLLVLVASPAVADDWRWKEGRQDLVKICAGERAAAIKALEKRLEKQPDHGEALFLLALATAQEGDLERAMGCVRRAVDAGLPIERFLAGPREVARPLISSDAFRSFARDRHGELVHGPTLGSVTDRSARFWMRTVHEAPVRVRWRVAGSSDSWRESAAMKTAASREYTAVVEAGALEPATAYDYRLVVDGRELERTYRFRTFPRAGSSARFDIVFGGGAAFTPSYERVFATIASHQPIAFLQLGDNVYIDAPTHGAVGEYCYYRRQSSAPYRELVASTNVAAIWDDHDFGTDDCHGGPKIDSPPWKRAVFRTFRNNWNNPRYGGGDERPGCWFDFTLGDVHFILLDCRYYRTAPKKPPRKAKKAKNPQKKPATAKRAKKAKRPPAKVAPPSMLGPEQKAWLFERLRTSMGTFKVIASSVPFSSGVKPGSGDPWDGYPEEREEIFSFVERQRIEGVVLIAADRHRSDAWRTERPNGYDLYEFQSSRLTNIHTHGVLKASLFGFNKDRSFGLLSFDTTKADPEVTYTIVDIDNRPVHTMTLRRSLLEFSSK